MVWSLRHYALYVAVCLAAVCLSAQAAAPPLVLERTIRLHDVGGRIDHMAIDLPRKRLIVAELGNNTVDIIDLSTDTPMHRFRDCGNHRVWAMPNGPILS